MVKQTPISYRPGLTSVTLARTKRAERELPPHEPGPVRDYLEKTGGVLGAIGRVPGSFLSGVLNGGFHGRRRGVNSEYQTDPATAATGVVVCNAALGLATGALAGFMVLGPVGAAASVAKNAAGSAFSTYLFIKGGSAAEMGRLLAGDIDRSVSPEDGAVKGLLKGAWAGGMSAAKGAAVTGYYEGRAATSGIFEGIAQVKNEISEAKKPGGSALGKTASAMAGTVAALLSAPAGLVHGVLSFKGTNDSSAVKRLAIAAVNGALIGGAAGLLGGPVGALVGGAAGAVLGLVSPAASRSFVAGVENSLQAAESNDTDLGHEITNRRRDLVQSAIVGAASGARSGWDAGVGFLRPSSRN